MNARPSSYASSKSCKIVEISRSRHQALWRAMHGVVFLSTPHRDNATTTSSAATGHILNCMTAGSCREFALSNLENISKEFGLVTNAFAQACRHLRVISFFETDATFPVGMVVIKSLHCDPKCVLILCAACGQAIGKSWILQRATYSHESRSSNNTAF